MAKSATRQTKPPRSNTAHPDDGAAEVAKVTTALRKQRFLEAMAMLEKIGDDDVIEIVGRKK